jgi:DNA-binding transcriptional LysR family regulator
LAATVPFDARISLQKLEVFRVIVEQGSVSRAAERLYVTQPVVSSHLRDLEDRLGTKLMRRSGNRMELTEAGRAALAWANDVLTHTHELAREIDGLADGSRGSAAIASSMTAGSYLLPPILAAFRRERDGAHIILSTSDPEHASASVEAGECDFAIILSDDDHASHPTLTLERICDEPLVLVTAPDGRPAASELMVSELATLPFVTSPTGLSRQRTVSRQLAMVGLHSLDVVIELGHAEAMKHAVRAGLGVAFLFRSSVEAELARGELREITVRDARLHAPIFIVTRADKRFTPIQQALLDDIREHLRRRAGY